ncbi:MAG: ATPase, T2SS/T4P/T4SS family [Candidatus Firestonebacteria bacterium]
MDILNLLKRKNLKEIILKTKKIPEEKLAVFDFPENILPEKLLKEDIVTEEELAKALAQQYEYKYVDISKTLIDLQFIAGFSLELINKYEFVPYKIEEGKLLIIISDPGNIEKIDRLKVLIDFKIEIEIAGKSSIRKILDIINCMPAEVEKITENFEIEISENEIEDVSLEKVSVDETQPIIKFVNSFIHNAIRRKASDIHIVLDDKELTVKYRVDGVLQKAMDKIDKKFHASIISRIKVMSELNIAEKRIPQDGRFKLKFQGRNIDFRVSILPTMYGEAAVIRILDKSAISLELNKLGFEKETLEKFDRLIREPYGMVLVTGPTGSGKTTTLYGVINTINTHEDKIITIEDPIEYLLPDVVQVPVNEKKGVTFAKGLRSILRHDPDKIMVGEIRDPETAQIAVQSALTGHLVFSTIHANNVIDVIGRLINMGVEPYEFIVSLNCILAQRLIRVICPDCKKQVKYSKEYIEYSGLEYAKYKDTVFFETKGCKNCNNTGYHGRTGIFELLLLSDRIKEMILNKTSFIEIRRIAKNEGMKELRAVGIEKAIKGITTLKEVNRVTFIEQEEKG